MATLANSDNDLEDYKSDKQEHGQLRINGNRKSKSTATVDQGGRGKVTIVGIKRQFECYRSHFYVMEKEDIGLGESIQHDAPDLSSMLTSS